MQATTNKLTITAARNIIGEAVKSGRITWESACVRQTSLYRIGHRGWARQAAIEAVVADLLAK